VEQPECIVGSQHHYGNRAACDCCSYKRLDASLDKDYINSVVSLRECLLEYEWRQHGKILAERK
jgi:hypothetical protein